MTKNVAIVFGTYLIIAVAVALIKLVAKLEEGLT